MTLGVDVARRSSSATALFLAPVGIKLSVSRPMIHLKCKKEALDVAPALSSPMTMR